MQRVGLINGKNITNDSDLTTPILASMTQGIIEGFGIVNGYLQQGKAVIKCRRTNGPELMAIFESDELLSIPSAGNKSIYIQIDQSKIDNGSNNNSDGSGIGSIVIADSFPITEYNWIELYSIVDGTPVDERKGPKSLLGGNQTKAITEDGINWEGFIENGKIYQYTIDNSRVNLGRMTISNLTNNIIIHSGQTKIGLIQSDGSDTITSKPGLSFEETGSTNTLGYYAATFINGGNQIIELLQTEVKTYDLISGAYDFSLGVNEGSSLDITSLMLMDLHSIIMNPSGTKLYIYGLVNTGGMGVERNIYEYNLTNPYDISTATLNNTQYFIDDCAELIISNDGSYMYRTSSIEGNISVYSLSTPYDISTRTFLYKTYINGISPSSIFWVNSNSGYMAGYSTDNGDSKIIKFTTNLDYDLRSIAFVSIGELSGVYGLGSLQIIGSNNQKIYFFGDFTMSGMGEVREYQYTETFDGTSLILIN